MAPTGGQEFLAPELIQLLQKHAPLEATVLLQAQQQKEKSATRPSSADVIRQARSSATSGAALIISKSSSKSHSTSINRNHVATASVGSYLFRQEHQDISDQALSNPVAQERALAKQRAQSTAAYADLTRLQAQARARSQAAQDEAEARVLLDKLNAAQQQDLHAIIPLQVPEAVIKPHLPGSKAQARTSTTSKPSWGVSQSSTSRPTAATQAESPGHAGRGRRYERPWTANMLKPGSKPRTLQAIEGDTSASGPGQSDGGSSSTQTDTAGGLDQKATSTLALPPSHGYEPRGLQPVMLKSGPVGTSASRSISPGTTRLDKINPVAKEELQRFMELKRQRMQAEDRERQQQQMIERTRPIISRKMESEKARQHARQYAEASQSKPHAPVARKAWVDVQPDNNMVDMNMEALRHQNKRRSASTGRGLRGAGGYEESEPDIDAVSLRGQPNRTTYGVMRDMRAGQKVRIMSTTRASMYGDLDEDDATMFVDGPQVVRVRDPEPAQRRTQSAPRTRPRGNRYAGAAVQEKDSNIVFRASSPARPVDVRYTDPLTRRAAAAAYSEQLRARNLELLVQQRNEARKQLRQLRKERLQEEADAAATHDGPARPATGTAPRGNRYGVAKKRSVTERSRPMTARPGDPSMLYGVKHHASNARVNSHAVDGDDTYQRQDADGRYAGGMSSGGESGDMEVDLHAQAGDTDAIAAMRAKVMELAHRIADLYEGKLEVTNEQHVQDKDTHRSPTRRSAWPDQDMRGTDQHLHPQNNMHQAPAYDQNELLHPDITVPAAGAVLRCPDRADISGGQAHRGAAVPALSKEAILQRLGANQQQLSVAWSADYVSSPDRFPTQQYGARATDESQASQPGYARVGAVGGSGPQQQQQVLPASPDQLQLKKPRLSLDDLHFKPLSQAGSDTAYIHVPTTATHVGPLPLPRAAPDPAAPFTAWDSTDTAALKSPSLRNGEEGSPVVGILQPDVSHRSRQAEDSRSALSMQSMDTSVQHHEQHAQLHIARHGGLSMSDDILSQGDVHPETGARRSYAAESTAASSDLVNRALPRFFQPVSSSIDSFEYCSSPRRDPMPDCEAIVQQHESSMHNSPVKPRPAAKALLGVLSQQQQQLQDAHTASASTYEAAHGNGGGSLLLTVSDQNGPNRHTHLANSLASTQQNPTRSDNSLNIINILTQKLQLARRQASISIRASDAASTHIASSNQTANQVRTAGTETEQQIQKSLHTSILHDVNTDMRRGQTMFDASSQGQRYIYEDGLALSSQPDKALHGDRVDFLATLRSEPDSHADFAIPAAAYHSATSTLTSTADLAHRTPALLAQADSSSPHKHAAKLRQSTGLDGIPEATDAAWRDGDVGHCKQQEVFQQFNLGSAFPGRQYVAQNMIVGGTMLMPSALEGVGEAQRVRLAPAELHRRLMDHLKKYEEVEELGMEMEQVAKARALALAQQEQHRLAREVDKITEMTQANAVARAAQQRKELEVRTLLSEGRKDRETRQTQQLHEIAAMFSQALQSQRVANAEAQTTTHDITPYDGKTGTNVAAVGSGHRTAAADVVSTRDARPSIAQAPEVMRQQVQAQAQGGPAPGAPGLQGRHVVPPGQHATNREDEDAELYSEVFDSAERTAQDLLFPSKVNETTRSIATENGSNSMLVYSRRAGHTTTILKATAVTSGSIHTDMDQTATPTRSISSHGFDRSIKHTPGSDESIATRTPPSVSRSDYSRDRSRSPARSAQSSPGSVSSYRSSDSPRSTGSSIADELSRGRSKSMSGSGSIPDRRRSSDYGSGFRRSGSIVDEISMKRMTATPGAHQGNAVTGDLSASAATPLGSLAKVLDGSPLLTTGTLKARKSARKSPFMNIRATATGDLNVSHDEMLTIMKDIEAAARKDIQQLEKRKAVLQSEAAHGEQQLVSQLQACTDASQKIELDRLLVFLQIKVDSEISRLDKQIIAIRDDLTQKKVQMHSLNRLSAVLSSPAHLLMQHGHSTLTSPAMGHRPDADHDVRDDQVTPTRSGHTSARFGGDQHKDQGTPSSSPSSSGSVYSEDFSAMQQTSLSQSIGIKGHSRSMQQRSPCQTSIPEDDMSGGSPHQTSRATSAHAPEDTGLSYRKSSGSNSQSTSSRSTAGSTVQSSISTDIGTRGPGSASTAPTTRDATATSVDVGARRDVAKKLGHSSTQSLELQQRKQQLMADIDKKKSQLRHQQTRKEIAALEKELAIVDAQLASEFGTKQQAGPAHRASTTSFDSPTQSQSPSQVQSSHIDKSPHTGSPSSGHAYSSSRSHDSIADDVHVTQQTRSISTGPSHSQQSDRSSGRRTSPSGSVSSRSAADRRATGSTADVGSASTDSLVAARAQLQQLQQAYEIKQRQALKAQIAAQTREVQQKIQELDKSMPTAPTGTSARKPPTYPATTTAAAAGRGVHARHTAPASVSSVPYSETFDQEPSTRSIQSSRRTTAESAVTLSSAGGHSRQIDSTRRRSQSSESEIILDESPGGDSPVSARRKSDSGGSVQSDNQNSGTPQASRRDTRSSHAQRSDGAMTLSGSVEYSENIDVDDREAESVEIQSRSALRSRSASGSASAAAVTASPDMTGSVQYSMEYTATGSVVTSQRRSASRRGTQSIEDGDDHSEGGLLAGLQDADDINAFAIEVEDLPAAHATSSSRSMGADMEEAMDVKSESALHRSESDEEEEEVYSIEEDEDDAERRSSSSGVSSKRSNISRRSESGSDADEVRSVESSPSSRQRVGSGTSQEAQSLVSSKSQQRLSREHSNAPKTPESSADIEYSAERFESEPADISSRSATLPGAASSSVEHRSLSSSAPGSGSRQSDDAEELQDEVQGYSVDEASRSSADSVSAELQKSQAELQKQRSTGGISSRSSRQSGRSTHELVVDIDELQTYDEDFETQGINTDAGVLEHTSMIHSASVVDSALEAGTTNIPDASVSTQLLPRTSSVSQGSTYSHDGFEKIDSRSPHTSLSQDQDDAKDHDASADGASGDDGSTLRGDIANQGMTRTVESIEYTTEFQTFDDQVRSHRSSGSGAPSQSRPVPQSEVSGGRSAVSAASRRVSEDAVSLSTLDAADIEDEDIDIDASHHSMSNIAEVMTPSPAAARLAAIDVAKQRASSAAPAPAASLVMRSAFGEVLLDASDLLASMMDEGDQTTTHEASPGVLATHAVAADYDAVHDDRLHVHPDSTDLVKEQSQKSSHTMPGDEAEQAEGHRSSASSSLVSAPSHGQLSHVDDEDQQEEEEEEEYSDVGDEDVLHAAQAQLDAGQGANSEDDDGVSAGSHAAHNGIASQHSEDLGQYQVAHAADSSQDEEQYSEDYEVDGTTSSGGLAPSMQRDAGVAAVSMPQSAMAKPRRTSGDSSAVSIESSASEIPDDDIEVSPEDTDDDNAYQNTRQPEIASAKTTAAAAVVGAVVSVAAASQRQESCPDDDGDNIEGHAHEAVHVVTTANQSRDVHDALQLSNQDKAVPASTAQVDTLQDQNRNGDDTYASSFEAAATSAVFKSSVDSVIDEEIDIIAAREASQSSLVYPTAASNMQSKSIPAAVQDASPGGMDDGTSAASHQQQHQQEVDSAALDRSGSTDSTLAVDEYTIEFEPSQIDVGTPEREPEPEPVDAAGASKEQVADAIVSELLDAALQESVQTIVSVAGGLTAVAHLSPQKRPAPSLHDLVTDQYEDTSPTSSPASSKYFSRTLSSSPDLLAADEQLEPLPGFAPQNLAEPDTKLDSPTKDLSASLAKTLPRSRPDLLDMDEEDDWNTNLSITDDDLNWQDDEDDLKDYKVNLGAYVVPEHDQKVIHQEAEAAAAPAVVLTPQAVDAYLEQVLILRQQEQGAWPEELDPCEDALALEGFLKVERGLEDASEAQHIANKLLYDAANEAIMRVYRAANRVKLPVWLRTCKFVRPLPPPEELLCQVKSQVKTWLCCKIGTEHDLDKLLQLDAAEDERQWVSLKEEAEADVILELADMIWEDLLEDTAVSVQDIDNRLSRRR